MAHSSGGTLSRMTTFFRSLRISIGPDDISLGGVAINLSCSVSLPGVRGDTLAIPWRLPLIRSVAMLLLAVTLALEFLMSTEDVASTCAPCEDMVGKPVRASAKPMPPHASSCCNLASRRLLPRGVNPPSTDICVASPTLVIGVLLTGVLPGVLPPASPLLVPRLLLLFWTLGEDPKASSSDKP